MRIVVTADLHGSLPVIEPCDLLLIAGDVCPDFHRMSRALYGADHDPHPPDLGIDDQRRWLAEEFRPWLERVPARDIVGVAGNHDFAFEVGEVPAMPWTYLCDGDAVVQGVRIWGSPWVVGSRQWAFSVASETLQWRAEAVPPCDVMLVHSPPNGYVDRGRRGLNLGDVHLNTAIGRARPRLVACGHVHEGRGTALHSAGAEVINAAHVGGPGWIDRRPPITIDLD